MSKFVCIYIHCLEYIGISARVPGLALIYIYLTYINLELNLIKNRNNFFCLFVSL